MPGEASSISGRRTTVTRNGNMIADLDWNMPEENLANAEFIVRACNVHAELLEMLVDTVKQLETAKYWTKQALGPTATALVGIEATCQKAKSLIAKIESKEN